MELEHVDKMLPPVVLADCQNNQKHFTESGESLTEVSDPPRSSFVQVRVKVMNSLNSATEKRLTIGLRSLKQLFKWE
jgi:hypothetical protein